MRRKAFRTKKLRPSQRILSLFTCLVLFSLVGTFLSKKCNLNPGIIAPITSLALLVVGAAGIGKSIGKWTPVLAVIGISIVAETVGLYSGWPFGRYEYTGTWWPSIGIGEGHTLPLLLPLAWILIVGGSFLTLRSYFNSWTCVVATAFLATLIDMPMERAMTGPFGYWKWIDKGPLFGAPIQNSIGWFAVSLAAAYFLKDSRVKDVDGIGPKILAAFCVFVSLTGFVSSLDSAWFMLGLIGFLVGMSALVKPLPPMGYGTVKRY